MQQKTETSLATVLEHLRKLKPELKARYHVKQIGLFGSLVRDEQETSSDIDVLVELDSDASLFDLVRLKLRLEEEFQRPVDVIPRESLRAEIRQEVLREFVAA